MAISVIDLFAGAGGLSHGLEQAKFNIIAAIDNNRDACDTFNAMHPDVTINHADIRELNFKSYEGIDLVVGGPPCQPFSTGGKRLARSDSRDMIPEYIRVLKEARPKMFLMENVPGLLSNSRKEYFEWILSSFKELGYTVHHTTLNAADYGIPQVRRRLFIAGVRDGRPFSFPKPTHGQDRLKPVTAGCVLSQSVIGERNPSVVVYAKHPDLRPSPYHGHLFNGGGRAINMNLPCHTILASAGGNKTHFIDTFEEVPKYHAHLMRGGPPRKGIFEGGRRLTVKESALIQTFPDDYGFKGSRSSQYAQIGNAVPPKLAAILGKALSQSLKIGEIGLL